MISRKHRFHGYGSLRYVYQHGKTIRGQLVSLRYLANPRRDSYRLAVVVSKKVSKSALVRNRIRRRLYEAVRVREAEIETAYDMVLTVFHEQLKDVPAKEIEQLVGSSLYQAGIFGKSQKPEARNQKQT